MSLIAICDRSSRSWYGDMEFEIILLRAYIKGVERQIAESVDTFHREQKSHVVHEDPDEGLVDVVNEHYGVDDTTYSIDYIFEEYFPDLQWGSALITLFSLFEHQLDDLCTRFSDEGKVAIKFESFKCYDKGIYRSTKYLKEQVGVSRIRDIPTWGEITNIQKVRNAIAHNGDSLKGHVDAPKDYLPSVIETFASYFKWVNELITRTDRA